MSDADPVAAYLQRYGPQPQQQDENDPVAAYLTRYRAPAAPAETTDPPGARRTGGLRQFVGNFARGGNALLRNAGEIGDMQNSFAERVLGRLGRYAPVSGVSLLRRAGLLRPEALAQEDREIQEWTGDPESGGAAAAGIGGRLLFEGALAGATGGPAGAGAKGFALSALRNRAASRLLAAPLDVVQAQNRDTSLTGAVADLTENETIDRVADSRLGRTIADPILGFAAGSTLEEGVRGVGALGRGIARAGGLDFGDAVEAGFKGLDEEALATPSAVERPRAQPPQRAATPTPVTNLSIPNAVEAAERRAVEMGAVGEPSFAPPPVLTRHERTLALRADEEARAARLAGENLEAAPPQPDILERAASAGAEAAEAARRSPGGVLLYANPADPTALREAVSANPAVARGAAGAVLGYGADAAVGDDPSWDGAVRGAALGALSAPGSWERLVRTRDRVADLTHQKSPALGNLLFTGHTLPEGYKAARTALRRGNAEANMVASEISQRVQHYTPAVQKVLSDLADAGADPAEITRRVYAAGADGDEAAKLVTDMHELFAGLGEDLLGLGKLSRQSLERFRGRYLPRYYRAAEQTAEEATGAAQRGGSALRLDQNALGRLARRSDDVSPEVAARRIDHFGFRAVGGALQEGKLVAGERFFQAVRGMDDVTHAGWRSAADELTAAKAARRPLRRAVEEARQMLEGARRVQAKSTDLAGDIAANRTHEAYVNRLREALEADRAAAKQIQTLKAEADAQAKAAERMGHVKLPEDKRLGSLSGAWVTKDVADDLKGITKPNGFFGDGVEFYDRWFRRWKVGKTVLNPATHGRNILGAQVLSWMGGGPTPFGSSYKRAWGIVRGARDPRRLSAAQRSIYAEARAAGLFDSSGFTGEVNAPLFRRGFVTNAPDDLGQAVGEATGAGRGVVRRSFDKIARAYHDEDVAARVAHFIYQRGKGRSVDEAAALAKKWVPTFEDQANIVKYGGRVIPFLGYPAAALPLVAEAASKNTVRFLAAGALTTGLSAMFFDEQVPEAVMPPEMRGGLTGGLLPKFVPLYEGEDGRRTYLDMTYTMPWGDIGEARGSGGLPAQADVMSNPFLGTFASIFSYNKDRLTGRPIRRPSASHLENTRAGLDYAYRQMLPSFAPPIPGLTEGGWSTQKVVDAATGTPNYRGETRDLLPGNGEMGVLAETVLGLKQRRIDPAEEYRRRQREIAREMDDLRARTREVLRDKGASDGAKQEAIAERRAGARRLARERARLRALRGQVPGMDP